MVSQHPQDTHVPLRIQINTHREKETQKKRQSKLEKFPSRIKLKVN